MTIATPTGIQQLYLAYTGRPVDAAAITAWPASGLSIEAIVLQLVPTAEYQLNTVDPNSTPVAGGGRTFNDTNLINTFYQRLFGRLASGVEVAGWSNALASGAVNYDYLGLTILNAGLNLSTTGAEGEMRAVLVAKLESNNLYTGILYNNPVSAAAYSTAAAIQDGIAYSSATTTGTPQTPDQAQAAVATMVADSGATGGQTFTLTAGVDTASAQLFIADPILTTAGNLVNTLQTGDRLTGSGTSPTIRAVIADVGAITNILPTLTGIQNFQLTNSNQNGFTLNGVQTTGLTNVVLSQALGATTFNNLQTKVDNISLASTLNNGFTLDVAASALTAADDSINLVLNGNLGTNNASAQTVSVQASGGAANGYEIYNITSSGSANFVNTLTTTGATTLNITGSQNLTLATAATLANTVTTVNAAEFTGALALGRLADGATAAAAGVAVSNVSITGGTGDDLFNLGGTLNNNDTVNGGSGRDILAITAASNPAANLSNLSNFEAVTFTGATGALNVNRRFFGGNDNAVDTISFGSGGNDTSNLTGVTTVTNLNSGNTVRFDFDADGTNPSNLTASLATDGSADVINLNTVDTNTGAAGVATMGTLTLTGYETINLSVSKTSGASAGGTLTFTTLTDAALATLNITGPGVTTTNKTNLTLTTLGGASTAVINAADFAGDVSIGAAGGLTTRNTGATITTGAGDDTIGFNITTQALNTVNAGTGNNTLNLFGTVTGTNAGTLIDLSQDDQVRTINGTVNNSVQSGFRNVSAAGTAGGVGVTIQGDTQDNFITGSGSADIINSGTGDDTIVGGAGSDNMSGDAGIDTYGTANNFGAVGTSTVASATNFTAGGLVAGETITFATNGIAGNVDTITDFVSGTDKLDVVNNDTAPTTLIAFGAGGLTNGTTFVVYGAYNATTGVFTTAAAYGAGNTDALVVTGDGNLTKANTTGYQVLRGLNQALIAADFI